MSGLRWSCSVVAIAASALGACSSQADPEYRGEALLVLSGSVERSDVDLSAASAVPVLAWYDWDKETAGFFQTGEVRGQFPSGFTMRVYEPPPDGALTQSDGYPPAATARIYALRDGKAWDANAFGKDAPPGPPPWFVGGVGNFLVLYLKGPAPADPMLRDQNGAPAALGAGHHLIELAEWTEEEAAARQQCFAAAEATALQETNEVHGTAYTDPIELPSELERDFDAFYDESQCGGTAKMTVVKTGLEHPLHLQIGGDVGWVDWF